jgi:hypothetical protein
MREDSPAPASLLALTRSLAIVLAPSQPAGKAAYTKFLKVRAIQGCARPQGRLAAHPINSTTGSGPRDGPSARRPNRRAGPRFPHRAGDLPSDSLGDAGLAMLRARLAGSRLTRRALKGASNPSRRRGRFLARLFYIAPYKESVRSQGSAGNNSEQHPHGKILPSRRSAYSP